MSSPLVQTLVGGGLAILGGLLTAWYQTRRADDVARRIRQSERREQALLELDALVSTLEARLDPLFRQAEQGQAQRPYQESLGLIGELAEHWRTKASGVIHDRDIVSAYNYVRVAADRIPSGAGYVAFMSNLQGNDPDTVRVFKRDLGHVLGQLGELRKVVRSRVENLLPREPWPKRAVARARATIGR